MLDESGWVAPVDQSVALIDQAGRTTHRTGMRTLTLRIDGAGGLGVAGSTTVAHWVEADPGQRDHGSGRAGRSWPAGGITVFSLVRGVWELRLARVDELVGAVDSGPLRLRVGGWAVAGDGAETVSPNAATATGAGLTSRVLSVIGEATAGVTTHEDGGPLGHPVRVPWLDHAARIGTWIAVLIELSGGDRPPDRHACHAALDAADQGLDVRVDWPDGVRTHTRLTAHTPGEAVPATRWQSGPDEGLAFKGE